MGNIFAFGWWWCVTSALAFLALVLGYLVGLARGRREKRAALERVEQLVEWGPQSVRNFVRRELEPELEGSNPS